MSGAPAATARGPYGVAGLDISGGKSGRSRRGGYDEGAADLVIARVVLQRDLVAAIRLPAPRDSSRAPV
jgi:hypothetical protein